MPKADISAAQAYESLAVNLGSWAADGAAWGGISSGEQVLDVACGTGVGTRPAALLAGLSGRVCGTDIDAGMLAVARAIAAPAQGAPLDWCCASAERLPFENHCFDAVLCLQGAQFFPDPALALAEMRRVLKRQGRVLVTVWREIAYCKGYQAVVAALERRGIDASPARRPFALGDEKTLRRAAATAGFRHITIRQERKTARFASTRTFLQALACGAPSSRFAMARVPPDDYPAFEREVAAALAPWQDRGLLRFPMESHVLQAQ